LIGSQVGPYTLLSELGSGGMGSVYLAEHDGQRVALKIVHAHLIATPGFFKRFLREAELGKQVQHENVVRTLDVDATQVDEKVVHYMVMEYVEGRSLRQLLTDLGTVPETLLREIALQVAAGLVAVHGAGVVHRDLKPENVLITDDQRIQIMDLGVAKLQEASVAITREGQFAGSFLYAAPEQFRNQEVGPASDLYSLGVLLYELATGVNPFRGADPAAVIHAHLETAPPRATEKNPDVSLFFAEVLATLLRKEPAARIVSAAALCRLLEEGEASAWWGERERELRRHEESHVQIKVRRETDLVGRGAELGALKEAWSRARGGEGGTLLIEGEPGIGKTRLVDAFVRAAAGDSVHVLYGSYPPSGGLGGLSEGILGKFGASGLDEALAPYLTVTPTLVPAFAALLKHESPPTGSEPIAGDTQHTGFGHLLRALAAERPTLWIVEDLQFASEDSRRLVLSLARAAEGQRVLLVATTRPGLPEQELTHFARLEHFRRLPVGRLSPREVVELAREAFGSATLADKLGGKIAYKSDGVPFFVFEMIRSLKEGGYLRELPDGTYEQAQQITDIEVPSAVKDLVQARLQELSEGQRAILDVGAVQGYEFDPDLVARVLEEKRVRVLRDLADIERRFGLVHGEAGTSRFDHNQVQEVLYRDLPPDLRSEYHALLADAFVERAGLKPGQAASGEAACFLAAHQLHGPRPAQALPHLEAALDHLAQSYRNDQALDLADRALAAPGLVDGERRLDLLLRKAGRLDLLGRRAEQSATLEEALGLADQLGDPGPRAAVRRALGEQATMMAQGEAAHAYLEAAIALAREAGDRREEAAAAGALGVLFFYTGQSTEVRAQFERQLVLAREIGDLNGVATATGRIGVGLVLGGDLEGALTHFERSLASSREIGNREREAIALLNAAEIYGLLGNAARGREMLEQSRALARSIGAQHVEGEGLLYRGKLEWQERQADRAEACYREALAQFRQILKHHGTARCLVLLGRLFTGLGRTAEALRHLEEGLALARENEVHEALVLGEAYTALLTRGSTEEARRQLTEHGARLELSQALEAHFVLWRADGDPALLEKAHAILAHMRDHAPAEYRTAMIENVPLHREILAAWDAR